MLLPATTREGSEQKKNPRLIAHRVLAEFIDKGQDYAPIVDIVLSGKVQYISARGEVITLFDEAYVTWLFTRDLVTIVIKASEFENAPQGNWYRVFARIPERGFTEDFHGALKGILKPIGS